MYKLTFESFDNKTLHIYSDILKLQNQKKKKYDKQPYTGHNIYINSLFPDFQCSKIINTHLHYTYNKLYFLSNLPEY